LKPALQVANRIIVLSGLALFAVGFVKGRLAAQSPVRSGMQFFGIAVSAALLGYGIDLAVPHFFPDIPVAS
jgi:VIT1/CCC1 family predicted Fe2+/Mn2+ transporter